MKNKLHLGCGHRYLEGFIHIDKDELPHIDYPNTDISDLSMFDDNSIDLGIFDPPYNISSSSTSVLNYKNSLSNKKNYSLFNESWDKFDSIEQYISWTDQWLNKAFSKLKDDGSMFIFGSYHNIGLVNYVLQKQKRMIINDIAW